MGMIDRLRTMFASPPQEREFLPWVTYNGNTYGLTGLTQTLQGNREEPPQDYTTVVSYMYRNNAVVFACVDNRVKLFSEARFQYRRLRNGRPGDLFGDASLAPLEEPWPGATTGDLLAQMLQRADIEGNAFAVRVGNAIAMPRPDWMTIALDGDIRDLGSQPIGYLYYPGGRYSGAEPVPLSTQQVAHFAPIPDPLLPHRGMSWMTPIVREVMADTAMTNHKRSFLENGATVNTVVTIDVAGSKASFDELVARYKAGHEGAGNAYKTLFATPAMKVEPVGSNLEQIDFKVVQGAGETRIAAAAGVPPVIVGLSEGLAAATYSNYAQARRRFADNTIRPLWRNVAGSLAAIINVPAGAELWYDDRDISALQEDQKDAAAILSVNVTSIVTAVNGGFEPPSAIAAITSGDLTKLVHTGLTSVQLQPPAPDEPPEPEPPEPPDAEDETEPPDEPQPKRDAERDELIYRMFEIADRRHDLAPVVNVTTPDVRIEAPITVNVPERSVTVEPTPVTVENTVTVEPTPVEITNEVSVEPTPVTITNEMPEGRAIRKAVIRDAKGLITEIVEEPSDGE